MIRIVLLPLYTYPVTFCYTTLHSVTCYLPCRVPLLNHRKQTQVVHTMNNQHPAVLLKKQFQAGLISLAELINDCWEKGWELERTERGNFRIKGRDNAARWVVTIRV